MLPAGRVPGVACVSFRLPFAPAAIGSPGAPAGAGTLWAERPPTGAAPESAVRVGGVCPQPATRMPAAIIGAAKRDRAEALRIDVSVLAAAVRAMMGHRG